MAPHIIRGYNFDKSYEPFDEYIRNIYAIKSSPSNKVERNIAKLVINSSIGRWGMYFLKPVSKFMNRSKHDIISTTRLMKNPPIEIGEDLFLDTYIPVINKKACEDFGVDFIKLLNDERVDDNSDNKYKSVSISTAAAILSYASIEMEKIILYILENGGQIYYTDTDSIVTNIKLPEYMVDSLKIGKLKLEYVIKEAFFIADKTYALKTVDGEIIKRAKGIDSSLLSFDDYRKMFNNEPLDNTIRTTNTKNYTIGSVKIESKKVMIDTTTYDKRSKIYEDDI